MGGSKGRFGRVSGGSESGNVRRGFVSAAAITPRLLTSHRADLAVVLRTHDADERQRGVD